MVRTPDLIPKFMEAIRDDANLQFKSIIDITGVDWPHREKRFDIVYHVLSMYNSNRLRVKTETGEHIVFAVCHSDAPHPNPRARIHIVPLYFCTSSAVLLYFIGRAIESSFLPSILPLIPRPLLCPQTR